MDSIEGRTDLPDYSACVLSIHVRGVQGISRIAYPKWQLIGGRLYLVGTWAPNPEEPDSFAGCETALAWEHVTDILVYRSVAEYERRCFPDLKKQDRVVSVDALRS